MSAQLKQTACALLLLLGMLSVGSAAAQSSVVYHLDNASIQGRILNDIFVIFRAFNEQVNPFGVSDSDDFRLGCHIQVIANIT